MRIPVRFWFSGILFGTRWWTRRSGCQGIGQVKHSCCSRYFQADCRALLVNSVVWFACREGFLHSKVLKLFPCSPSFFYPSVFLNQNSLPISPRSCLKTVCLLLHWLHKGREGWASWHSHHFQSLQVAAYAIVPAFDTAYFRVIKGSFRCIIKLPELPASNLYKRGSPTVSHYQTLEHFRYYLVNQLPYPLFCFMPSDYYLGLPISSSSDPCNIVYLIVIHTAFYLAACISVPIYIYSASSPNCQGFVRFKLVSF